MTNTRMLTAAAILMACGCAESPAGPGYTIARAPEAPEPVVITGTVTVAPDAVLLQLESGDLVALVGSEAQRLLTLDGDEVQLRGDWIISGSPPLETDVSVEALRHEFAVTEFLVLAVAGRPALDGLLGKEDGRYYLTLPTGGVFWLDDGPSGFEPYIGKRIWVTGSMVDPPLQFGVIE